MEQEQIEKWVGAQVVGIILDIMIIPFIRIFVITWIKSFLGCLDRDQRSDLFLFSSSAEAKTNMYPTHVLSTSQLQDDIPGDAREKRIQKGASYLALYRIVFVAVATISCFILSESIVSNQKYFLDYSYRRRIRTGHNWKVMEIWDLIRSDVANVNFRRDGQNEIISNTMEQYGTDRTSFRIGPAKLVQYREKCESYKKGWKGWTNESIPEYYIESPLDSPWLLSDSIIPLDWMPVSVSKELFGKCAFEGRVFHLLKTPFMILYRSYIVQ